MAGHRSMVLRVDVRECGRLAHCQHNKKHVIRKGEARLVLKDPGPAAGEKGYCIECGRAMIDKAEAQLGDLRAALDAFGE